MYRPTAFAIFDISDTVSLKDSIVRVCSGSHEDYLGFVCVSIISPSAPAATAAMAKGFTSQYMPPE